MARSWIVGVLLTGCGGGGEVTDVAFVPGIIPGTGEVTFASDTEGGTARVEMGVSGDPLDVVSPGASASSGSVPLLGLKTGKRYEMKVVIEADGEEIASETIEATVPPPSEGVPPLTVASSDPAGMCGTGGYILFSYLGNGKSGVGIIDREANYVWSVEQADPALQTARARPGRDGKSILWNDADAERCTDVATITRQPMDGSAPTVTRTKQGHHDFVELPDGKLGWLGYRMEPNLDPPQGVDLGPVTMAVDTIYETSEGNTDADSYDVVFDTIEHYQAGVYTLPQESVLPNGKPKFLCTGPNAVPEWGAPAYEFGHANSLAYRESDDSYFMMWRWLDTLIKVDRGNPVEPYVWEMGGEFGDPAFDLSSGTEVYQPHFSDVWDGGILLFDNRHAEGTSRIVEYAFDDSSREQVWEYESDRYELLLGDARRIPIEGCDNVLVAFSNQGRISEINRDGDIVWDATSSIGNVISRIYFLPDIYDFTGAAYPE